VVALHYNHATEYSDLAEKLVSDFCEERDISLLKGKLLKPMPDGVSREDFWRKSRYNFFETIALTPAYSNIPIITCHHLDDLMETWVFTSLHGDARLIPSKRGRFLRPFLITRKAVLEDWCDRKDVPFITDPSNSDLSYMRNYIRHEIVPRALRINPGLPKVLRKKVINTPSIFE
jgi:tRNA(Ile)-lysidine synthase